MFTCSPTCVESSLIRVRVIARNPIWMGDLPALSRAKVFLLGDRRAQ
jgi:hypothetical protein